MKSIRILHYGISKNIGGIESAVLSWESNLPESIHFDILNDTNEKLLIEDKLRFKETKIISITHRYVNPIKRIKDFNRVFKDGNYDYFHYHVMNLDDPFPILIAKKYGVKPIVHCHSMYLNKPDFKENLLQLEAKCLLMNQDYFKISCGYESGKKFYRNNKFCVIENGVDINKYKFNANARKKIRTLYSLKKNDKVIGHVGRLCVEKNYPFILSTMKKLFNIDDNVKLMLVGNMDKDELIQSTIKALKLQDKVICTGRVDNVNDYYSAFDCFYMPSISEGLPFSAVEAQISGLRCVLSQTMPKEINVSNNISFIPFDIDVACSELMKAFCSIADRKNINIKKEYDIQYSSKKLFDFYRTNL